MGVYSGNFTISTHGKGTYEITRQVATEVKASGMRNGTVTVFVRHTSCSLIIMENVVARSRSASSAMGAPSSRQPRPTSLV
jgi:thiamine phosphate synthase YjbQ (UPF0047 family)